MLAFIAAVHRHRAGRARRGDEGYVIVIVTIMLTLIITMVGFSVDMGAWYRRASKIQNAVDSAALAGVMYLPGDMTTARSTARELLSRNGIVDGVDNMAVTVDQVPSNPRRLRVCATDGRAPALFARLVQSNPRIRRCATAEYVLPVALGSPLNIFDQANLGIWPAVNGFCTALEEGDYVLSKYRANKPPPGTVTGCPGATGELNPDYRAGGYNYIVEIGAAPALPVAIELYDATFHLDAGSPDLTPQPATATVDTTFSVYDLQDTPLDTSDDVFVTSTTVNSNDTAWKLNWRNLYEIPAGEPEGTRYRVQVATSPNQANSVGSNSFGIRARRPGTFSRCTTISGDPGYLAACPQVFAEDAMSVFANAAVNPATFYLGSIPSDFAGKTMVVTLFDPGEGARYLEILDPNGTPVSFGWATADEYTAASGTTSRLDVSGTTTRLPNRNGASRYNERMLELQIALPTDYATRYAGKTWWRIRYTSTGTNVSDRTTWNVAITGEPVRLVPDADI